MKRGVIWIALTLLLVVSLVLTSCNSSTTITKITTQPTTQPTMIASTTSKTTSRTSSPAGNNGKPKNANERVLLRASVLPKRASLRRGTTYPSIGTRKSCMKRWSIGRPRRFSMSWRRLRPRFNAG